ncbi:MAG: V-type ATP synthase subunit E [Spirochaetaceae bacterium]|jgi:V/A-type H+-transporting ATPase subunit E|nr:V-type ATP synthase subunit E [Spirochaetaceae bacterium]
MDAQLKELIEKIKIDGVKTAEDQAAVIVTEAQSKAQDIIEDANKEAEGIRIKAQKDALRAESSGKEALSQASRNLLIELRKKVENLLNTIVSAEVSQALKGQSLANSLEQVMKNWSKGDVSQLDVLLPKEQYQALEKDLFSKLASEMKKGLEIKPFEDLDSGFRVSSKDGKMFYDFSDDELSKMISRYLNQQLQEILNQ